MCILEGRICIVYDYEDIVGVGFVVETVKVGRWKRRWGRWGGGGGANVDI